MEIGKLKRVKKPVSELPINKKICQTCMFKLNKQGHWQNTELACRVIDRTLFKTQQICHTTNKTRCKGSYDYNKTIYERMELAHLLK